MRYYGRGDVRLDEIPEPEPAAGQVKIQISHNGVCGTDVHEYYDGPIVHPVEPDPLTGATIPVGIGHEASGTVVAVGPDIDPSVVSSRVAINPVITCGECAECLHGEPTHCPRFAVLGLSTHLGGLADYVIVERRKVHQLAASVSLAQAALVEPIAVAHRAVGRTAPRHDDSVLVLGAGPIGIGVLLTLRALGEQHVVVSEPSPVRQSVVSALGFDVVDPTALSSTNLARYARGGRGFGAAIDAAGTQSSFTTALDSVRSGATVMLVAVAPGRLEFAAHPLVVTEKTIATSIVYSDEEFAEVVANMNNGLYATDDWYEEIELDRYITGGLERLHARTVTKVIVRVS